jgi:hypothetical protein
MDFPYLLTLIRLVLPLFILKWPLLGIVLTNFADTIDWKLFPFTNSADYQYYQTWDKALDLFAQIFIVAIVLGWKEKLARTTALFFFGFRLIGVILFELTHFRPLLLLFPNVFDNFVFFYLFCLYLFKRKQLSLSFESLSIILSALIFPKLFHEYFMHYLLKQPWELYDVGKFLGMTGAAQELTNYFTWGILLYVIPMCGVLF